MLGHKGCSQLLDIPFYKMYYISLKNNPLLTDICANMHTHTHMHTKHTISHVCKK